MFVWLVLVSLGITLLGILLHTCAALTYLGRWKITCVVDQLLTSAIMPMLLLRCAINKQGHAFTVHCIYLVLQFGEQPSWLLQRSLVSNMQTQLFFMVHMSVIWRNYYELRMLLLVLLCLLVARFISDLYCRNYIGYQLTIDFQVATIPYEVRRTVPDDRSA